MQTKSIHSNSRTLGSGVLEIMRSIGITVITITAVLVLVGTMLGLSGCSGDKGKKVSSQAKQESSSIPKDPVTTTSAVTTTDKPAVTAKKKSVNRRARTVAYSSSTYGVSFRFPSEFNLITSRDDEQSIFPEPVPTNFVQPGGVTMATLELPGTGSSSFFNVSAHKGLSYQQCQQFSVPDPSDMAGNSPVDSHDGSMPSKTSIHGVDFSRVENSTEQEDVKYYHHFEPASDGTSGTCYEFALGVEDSHVSAKTFEQPEVFDKLERIMATVKIKQEPSMTATVPAPSTNTNPQ
ncbi:MAG TPA: hypothetical protein VJA94_05425 [Candidatus Angelobacter sp.]